MVLGGIPRDPHQELRAPLHPPSEINTRPAVLQEQQFKTSLQETSFMIILQDQQLNYRLNSRDPRIMDTCWSIVLYKCRGLSLG